jgi:FtsP/CotA-like multicopper oxidase with cupredoxin domain
MSFKDHILMQGKKMGLGLIATLMAGLPAVSPVSAAQSPQTPLTAGTIPQFAQSLPLLSIGGDGTAGIATFGGIGPVEIHICEFDAKVLPPSTPGVTANTRSWGYVVGTACPAPSDPTYTRDSFLGPVLVAIRNMGTQLKVVNDLPSASATGVLAYKYSVDQTVHWADPLNDEVGECHHAAQMGAIPAPGSECAENYAGPIPAAVHLHGGLVPAELDGGPDAWVTSDGRKGHGYYTSSPAPSNGFVYNYPNRQEASALIFHDHVLGNLRLNLYAGIAAGYVIEDPAIIPTDATGAWVSTVIAPLASCDPKSKKCLPSNLPGSAEIIPVVIQDRMFDTNGQLFWPADTAGGVQSSPNPQHPYWAPDFFGDTIVVNGKAWPYLEIEPKRYRFLFINASHSRIYDLNLGIPFHIIATDGGYLDKPVKVDHLPITSGERYEVIIDFADHAGHYMVLTNSAAAPYPNGTSPNPATLGNVMQFRIASAVTAPDASYDPDSRKALVRGKKAKLVRLVKPTKGKLDVKKSKVAATRQFIFNNVIGEPQTVINPVTGVETAYPGGELEILANNTKWFGTDRIDFTPITLGGVTNYYSEFNAEGTIEVVEFVNLTEESHAQHLHGTTFQVLNRQEFDTGAYTAAYNGAFPGGAFIPGFGPPLDYNPSTASGNKYGGNPDVKPYLEGKALRPRPEEAGWKDTVITLPGQVTRVAVRYAPTDLSTKTKAADLYFPFDPSGNTQYGFVHHCHMTEHEDNEMMRPNLVTLNPDAPAPASRPLKKGVDY